MSTFLSSAQDMAWNNWNLKFGILSYAPTPTPYSYKHNGKHNTQLRKIRQSKPNQFGSTPMHIVLDSTKTEKINRFNIKYRVR
jgi:hypothetical protein